MRSRSILMIMISVATLFQNCGQFRAVRSKAEDSTLGSSDPTPTPNPVATIAQGSSWFWQEFGALKTTDSAQVFITDLVYDQTSISQAKANSRPVLCYYSAGVFEPHRFDAGSYGDSVKGSEIVAGSGFKWLDIRDQNVRSLMVARMDRAVAIGCAGIIVDDLNGFSSTTSFPITQNDALSLLQLLATEAHLRGLAIGMFSSGALNSAAAEYADLVIGINCYSTNSCADLQPFLAKSKATYDLEYSAKNDANCNDAKAKGISLAFDSGSLNGSTFVRCD